MMDSKGLARWRGLVCVTPEKFSGCAKRPPKGVSPKFFCARRGGVGRVMVWRSVLVWQHDGNCGRWVVNVQRAASGNQFDKAGGAVVVADVKRNGQTVATWAGADDRKSRKPYDVP